LQLFITKTSLENREGAFATVYNENSSEDREGALQLFITKTSSENRRSLATVYNLFMYVPWPCEIICDPRHHSVRRYRGVEVLQLSNCLQALIVSSSWKGHYTD
jgi:hypothetical protein